VTGKDFKTVMKEMKIGDILDETKLVYFIEMLISLQNIFDSASSKEELVERLADLSGNRGKTAIYEEIAETQSVFPNWEMTT